VDGLIPPAVPSSEKLISCCSDQKRFLMMNKVSVEHAYRGEG
jgi:hypothetical protein